MIPSRIPVPSSRKKSIPSPRPVVVSKKEINETQKQKCPTPLKRVTKLVDCQKIDDKNPELLVEGHHLKNSLCGNILQKTKGVTQYFSDPCTKLESTSMSSESTNAFDEDVNVKAAKVMRATASTSIQTSLVNMSKPLPEEEDEEAETINNIQPPVLQTISDVSINIKTQEKQTNYEPQQQFVSSKTCTIYDTDTEEEETNLRQENASNENSVEDIESFDSDSESEEEIIEEITYFIKKSKDPVQNELCFEKVEEVKGPEDEPILKKSSSMKMIQRVPSRKSSCGDENTKNQDKIFPKKKTEIFLHRSNLASLVTRLEVSKMACLVVADDEDQFVGVFDITNKCNKLMTYKVVTNKPARYFTTPCIGYIDSYSTVKIRLSMKGQVGLSTMVADGVVVLGCVLENPQKFDTRHLERFWKVVSKQHWGEFEVHQMQQLDLNLSNCDSQPSLNFTNIRVQFRQQNLKDAFMGSNRPTSFCHSSIDELSIFYKRGEHHPEAAKNLQTQAKIMKESTAFIKHTFDSDYRALKRTLYVVTFCLLLVVFFGYGDVNANNILGKFKPQTQDSSMFTESWTNCKDVLSSWYEFLAEKIVCGFCQAYDMTFGDQGYFCQS